MAGTYAKTATSLNPNTAHAPRPQDASAGPKQQNFGSDEHPRTSFDNERYPFTRVIAGVAGDQAREQASLLGNEHFGAVRKMTSQTAYTKPHRPWRTGSRGSIERPSTDALDHVALQ